MVVTSLIPTRRDALEAVEVQLTLEGGKLGLAKPAVTEMSDQTMMQRAMEIGSKGDLLGEDSFDEILLPVNHEATPMRRPAHDVVEPVALELSKHVVKLHWEVLLPSAVYRTRLLFGEGCWVLFMREVVIVVFDLARTWCRSLLLVDRVVHHGSFSCWCSTAGFL